MYFRLGSHCTVLRVAALGCLAGCLVAISGCGGSSRDMGPSVTLTVSLANPKIVLKQGGMTTSPVTIMAPTESVALQVDNLPAGVMATYSATPSNPSGALRFAATNAAPVGSYMPRVTVMTSGHAAFQVFSMEIDAATKP